MRKKQLFAVLLTGALTVGMMPQAAFAAEGLEAVSIEGAVDAAVEEPVSEGENGGEAAQNPETTQPTQAPADVPTDVPAETTQTPSEPTQEPTDVPSEPTQAPTDVPTDPTQAPTDVPAEPTQPAQEPADNFQPPMADPESNATETPTPTPEVKGSIMIDKTAYESIQAAVDAVPQATDETAVSILLSGDVELSSTVTIANKNINLVGVGDVSLTRAAGFTGNMFQVEGGTFQLAGGITQNEDGTSSTGTLYVDGSLDDGTVAQGSIVAVNSGIFGLNDGVTLTGNTTQAKGGAVNAEAGNVVLMGGSITGNKAAEGGAIYSVNSIAVQGTINVSGNTKLDGTTVNNIVLGTGTGLNVSGKLSESTIGISVAEPAAGTQVITVLDTVTDMTIAEAAAQVTYDDPGFTVDENGALKVSEITPTPEVSVTPTPEISVTPTPEVSVTPEPTKTPLKLTGVTYQWTSYNSVKIVCVSNKDGWYYVDWVGRGEKAPALDTSENGVDIKADHNFTIYLSDLDPDKAIDAYVRVKDKDGNVTKKLLFQLDEGKRPAAPATPTPAHVPVIPAVTESRVLGLEEPLAFYANQFYSFTVIGAGTENNNPGLGDVKWVPLYWSMYANPGDKDKHQTWQLGAKDKAITKAATYDLYVFFQKWEYDGNDWQQTDTISSAVYQFSSKAISVTASPTPTTPGGYYGGDGSGSGSGYDDPYYQDGDTDSTGTNTAGAVATADESPVGTMTMLALASLLAGGYVLIRRRKKEI